MFDCTCSKCTDDITHRSNVYCEACYTEMEDKIEEQRREIDRLDTELVEMQNRLDEATDKRKGE